MRSAARRSRRSSSWAAVSLAALVAAGCGGGGGGSSRPAARGTALPGAKVAIVVLENTGPDAVLGSTWLGRAAAKGGRAVNAFGETHPSLGNYLAMISGATQGVSDDDVADGPFDEPTIAGQLERAKLPWRAYMNGMPSPCFGREGGADVTGRYAKRHNPFLFFTEIVSRPALCAQHVVPGSSLPGDEQRGLGRFVWITPDLCEDKHDCPAAAAQRWMAGALPALIAALGPHGVVFVVADEGEDDSHGGGRIPLVALGPAVRPGAVLSRPVNHVALLATVEDLLGLPRLPSTVTAPTLRALLRG